MTSNKKSVLHSTYFVIALAWVCIAIVAIAKWYRTTSMIETTYPTGIYSITNNYMSPFKHNPELHIITAVGNTALNANFSEQFAYITELDIPQIKVDGKVAVVENPFIVTPITSGTIHLVVLLEIGENEVITKSIWDRLSIAKWDSRNLKWIPLPEELESEDTVDAEITEGGLYAIVQR